MMLECFEAPRQTATIIGFEVFSSLSASRASMDPCLANAHPHMSSQFTAFDSLHALSSL